MANSNLEPASLEDVLRYVLNHVFLPPKLPQQDDYDAEHEAALCQFVYGASLEFATFLSPSQQLQWSIVIQMLKNLLESTRVLDKDVLITNVSHLEIGGQSCRSVLRAT